MEGSAPLRQTLKKYIRGVGTMTLLFRGGIALAEDLSWASSSYVK